MLGFGAVKKSAIQEQIRLLNEASKRDYISPIALATNYAVLGKKDKAFEWLEKAYEERAPGLLDLETLIPTMTAYAPTGGSRI